jgi:diadenosine tetraphosphate (Ap4A) HIT family hydrolase
MCPFCVNAEVLARAVVREELAWAFPSNIPIVPGHILIAPIRHAAKWDDMTAAEQSAIFNLLKKLKDALAKEFQTDGFNIAWNEGEIAGQSVPHFHLHVVPRKSGDTGVTEYEPRKFLYRPGSREASPQAELVAVAKRIQKHLD